MDFKQRVEETEQSIKGYTERCGDHPYYRDPSYQPLGHIENMDRDFVRHALFGTHQKTSMGWGAHRDPSHIQKLRALVIVDELFAERGGGDVQGN